MPKFSANLSMMFGEVPFLERFAAAAQAGFKAVEFMFPYDYPAQEIKDLLDKNNLSLVLFNLPAGNWAAGDRGIAVDPRRVEEFRGSVRKAVEYAKVLGTPRMNCLVGKKLSDVPEAEQLATLIENLRFAADTLAADSLTLLVEHLNAKDMPGFTLSTTRQVFDVIEAVNRRNIFLQYDIYHAQRMEGELVGTLRKEIARIGHIQIADNPGRHEPGTGEINYPFVFASIDEVGYAGHVGLEYVPAAGTVAGLSWLKDFGYKL
jgi:hydroxypyruvate isomerase